MVILGYYSRQGIQFLWLVVSSRAELSAEVLFLRKQLAFYQEHQVQPRKLTDTARDYTLRLLLGIALSLLLGAIAVFVLNISK